MDVTATLESIRQRGKTFTNGGRIETSLLSASDAFELTLAEQVDLILGQTLDVLLPSAGASRETVEVVFATVIHQDLLEPVRQRIAQWFSNGTPTLRCFVGRCVGFGAQVKISVVARVNIDTNPDD